MSCVLSPFALLGMAGIVMEEGLSGVCLPLTAGEVYNIDGFRLEVCAAPAKKDDEVENAGCVLYEVSSILGHRWARDCYRGARGSRREFLTVYKGYESQPTWQPVWDFEEDGVITNLVLLRYLGDHGL
jgi:hypothetical protein